MRRMFLCLLIFFGFLRPMGSAQAAGISFAALDASYTFADQMIFTATVASDAPITQATVFFQSGSQPPYSHPADPFTATTPVSLTAIIDLKETRLSPFSTISYWWEVNDQAGQTARSSTQTLIYVDNRFAWQDFASGPARVHWYQGDSGFGAAAATSAAEVLPVIQQQISVEPPSPLDVYIYASLDDLRSAVELAGREWLGGQARPELGVVLVAIPPGDSARLQMRRDIPHELTHLMTFVAASPNYDAVPRWLDEGLATLNEGEPNSTQIVVVQDALARSQLIPIASLCGAFPTDASAALLAYGQSRSLVQQIINEYGSAGIQALLAAYRDGASCDGGVERALSISLIALELKWRTALQANTSGQAVSTSIPTTASGIWPWFLLIAVIALPLIVILVWRTPAKRDTVKR
ncbi:MAG TPA: peptidase MA family metallohydrolase [Anaerolineae bacterium]|nr:peptidase MA family metallohydrolase [Anaerolineae bacterium]